MALAAEIAKRPGLRFVGLFGWESHAIDHRRSRGEGAHRRATRSPQLTASARACREAGHGIEIVSCGGTGTFPYCIAAARRHRGADRRRDLQRQCTIATHYHIDFPVRAHLLATVTSRPTPTRIVLDAGRKTMSGDAAMPEPLGLPAVER